LSASSLDETLSSSPLSGGVSIALTRSDAKAIRGHFSAICCATLNRSRSFETFDQVDYQDLQLVKKWKQMGFRRFIIRKNVSNFHDG